MKPILTKIKTWYRNLPDKKKYLELVSAALTVPMLLTVIVINLNNINGQKNVKTEIKAHPPVTDTPIQVIITQTSPEEKISTSSTTPAPTLTSTPTPSISCLQEIGPVEIISPQENEIVTSNSVCLNISTSSKYCPLVWSYQINDDPWSNFNNNDICLYNLSNGQKQLQVKFKNSTTGQTVTIARNFTYQLTPTTSTLTPTPTLIPTPTPTL